ncbi:hypothetical protein J6590_039298 [Homalodisca vitripennis]|nr:hypothetical protein J6590_039298 [Homalodisca vitripennis]
MASIADIIFTHHKRYVWGGGGHLPINQQSPLQTDPVPLALLLETVETTLRSSVTHHLRLAMPMAERSKMSDFGPE